MFEESILLDIFYYLGATVALVPLFKSLGLGGILGYLVSGILLGPAFFGLLHHSNHIQQVSDFGIIMLLFVIGLELSPARLSKLKGVIFKDGMSQFCATSTILASGMYLYGMEVLPSIVIACSLSLSSTAFALYYLKETDQLTKSYGQSSFSILLFQDLIIIPLLTILPFFAQNTNAVSGFDYTGLAINILITVSALVVGKVALIPAIAWLFRSQSKEIFISSCLMLIIGASLLMDQVGLSKALGSFLAGIFLTNSEFRSEISSFTVPLKSMLMGVFFMAFGLSIDVAYFREHIVAIIAVTVAFTLCKGVVLIAIGKIKTGSWSTGLKMGLLLGQGGEFGILIITSALSYSIITTEHNSFFISCVTLSIFMSPFFSKIVDLMNKKETTIIENVVSINDKVEEQKEEEEVSSDDEDELENDKVARTHLPKEDCNIIDIKIAA